MTLCLTLPMLTDGLVQGQDSKSPGGNPVPFFTVLGLVGALCGLLLALLGTLVGSGHAAPAQAPPRDDAA